MIAAKLANMKQGAESGNQRASKNNSAQAQSCFPSTVSIPEAADKLNVGTRTVTSCRKVQRDGVPRLVKAVESGEIRAKPAATTEAEEPS